MTDRNFPFEENQAPEEAATSYSWANLHGAKYRDFSASRAPVRERVRQLAQEVAEAGRQQAGIGEGRPNGQDLNNEVSPSSKRGREEEVIAALRGGQLTPRPTTPARELRVAQNSSGQQPFPDGEAPRPGETSEPPFPARFADRASPPALLSRSGLSGPESAPGPAAGFEDANDRLPRNPMQPPRENLTDAGQWEVQRENQGQKQREERQPESRREEMRRENVTRPAWLAEERRIDSQTPAPKTPPKAPEDTLQGSRDRLTSRWFALKALFEAAGAANEPAPAPSTVTLRAPVLAVFSLAGGVGKTSVVATLGRALSARGERVLLVDTAAFGLLPFFFGARDQRVGVLRTFSPPAAMGDAPVQMITLDVESLALENGAQEALPGEIAKYAPGISRVIVDLATASGGLSRQLLRMAPLVLVPMVPDMNSVVSVGSIDAFFERVTTISGPSALPYYVLNQFDPSLPLHLDVREVLLEQLGDRLLPFALRRTPAVSEALAEGMTVIDYAPNSTVAEDFASLAGWLKSVSAPATGNFRGVRWSER